MTSMGEFLLGQIQEYKTLGYSSPFRTERVFDTKSQKSTLRVLSFIEWSFEQQKWKVEALKEKIKTTQPDRRGNYEYALKNLLSGQSYEGFMYEAEKQAYNLVVGRKGRLEKSIIETTKSFVESQLRLGKVAENVKYDFELMTFDSVEACEKALFLLGVVNLKASGDYSALFFADKPLALQKKVAEVKDEEQFGDEGEGEDV